MTTMLSSYIGGRWEVPALPRAVHGGPVQWPSEILALLGEQ